VEKVILSAIRGSLQLLFQRKCQPTCTPFLRQQ
jgi:hypothetical protein